MAKTAPNQPKRNKKALKQEEVIVLYCEGFSQLEISSKTGVPKSTVYDWIKKYRNENPDTDLNQIREKKKNNYAARAWDTMDDSLDALSMRIRADLDIECEIEKLKKTDIDNDELQERIALLRKNADSTRDIISVIDKLYEKQALAHGDSTQNTNVVFTLPGGVIEYAE